MLAGGILLALSDTVARTVGNEVPVGVITAFLGAPFFIWLLKRRFSTLIELSGVDVHYGARKVLDAISFDAKKGTFVGIIGPNGSGKTTLLKAISRVITPTGGIIQLDGQPLFALSSRELAQSVAVVPQETGPGFDFTVSDVVMMGAIPT